MANASLRKADKIEFDEYYTQYEYIQKEVNAYLEYNQDVFKDKVILLPFSGAIYFSSLSGIDSCVASIEVVTLPGVPVKVSSQ